MFGESDQRASSVTLWITLGWILGFFLLANALSDMSSSSEAREVLVAKTLASGGDWLVPTRNGIVASKPPLHHWISATAASTLQSTSFLWIHRSVSSFFAFGVLALLVFGALRICGDNPAGYRRGFLAISILGLTPAFLRLASDARVDMVFAFFVVLATFSFLLQLAKAETVEELAAKPFWLCFLGMGVGCLAKGPLGIVLPLCMMLGSTIARFGVLPTLRVAVQPRFGWFLVLLTGPLWYAAGLIVGGERFAERHVFENVVRLVGDESIDSRPWWFYLRSWATGAFPWFFVFVLFLYSGRLFSRERQSEHLGRLREVCRLERSLFVSCLIGTVLFSISSGKRSAYLMPLYPLFAMYLACRISDLAETSSQRWKLRLNDAFPFLRLFGLALVTLFVLLVAVCTNMPPGDNRLVFDLIRYCSLHLLPLLLGALAIGGMLVFRTEKFPVLAQIVSAVIAMTVLFNGFGQGVKAEFKGFHRFAQEVNRIVPLSESLLVQKRIHDESYDVLLTYLHRPVTIRPPRGEVNGCFRFMLTYDQFSDDTARWIPRASFQSLGAERRGEREALYLLEQVRWEEGCS